MRFFPKRVLSAALAIALLGSAVMLSVSLARGPFGERAENAFEDQSFGHPQKALIYQAGSEAFDHETGAAGSAFDWGLETDRSCPRSGFKDSKVMPVVLDMPELLGGSDEEAVQVIKRKLGIDPFRGSIFEEPGARPAKLPKLDVASELKSFDNVLEKLAASEKRTSEAYADLTVCSEPSSGCGLTCESANVEKCEAADGGSLAVIWAEDESEPSIGVHRGMPSEPVELLRLAGPSLDEVANELEKADLYDEADAVRKVAHQLRLKARQLKSRAAGRSAAAEFKAASASAGSCTCCQNACGVTCTCADADNATSAVYEAH